jgi:hypothetical protein
MDKVTKPEQGYPNAWKLYCPTCKALRYGQDWGASPGGVPMVTCRFCRNVVVVPEDKRW